MPLLWNVMVFFPATEDPGTGVIEKDTFLPLGCTIVHDPALLSKNIYRHFNDK